MKTHIKFNIDSWLSNNTIFAPFQAVFDDIENLENCSIQYDIKTIVFAHFLPSINPYAVSVVRPNGTSNTIVGNENILAISSTNTYIEFDCNIVLNTDIQKNSFLWLVNNNIIQLDRNGNTTFLIYTQNCENDVLNKTLSLKGVVTGQFNHSIAVKNINIDVSDLPENFNYVYIPSLSRYYYVDSIEIITANVRRLHLKEDVLMSWKSLILQQDAFVTRYGGATDKHLVDERYPVDDIPVVTYTWPSNVSGVSVVEFKYKMPVIQEGSTIEAPNILLKTIANGLTLASSSDDIEAPTGTGLPTIQSRRSPQDHHYLINFAEYGFVMNACISNDAPSSFIRSILLLPFDLRDIFTYGTKTAKIYSGDKQLNTGNGGEWGASSGTPINVFETEKGGSPYILVADFYFNSTYGISISDNYLDFSPNTLWEIYLMFVGWIQLDAKAIYNHRIQIYYTFDLDTGISTAYIYDNTKTSVIWSGNCQIGMKLPLAVTNREELARQKQATTLNLLMGLGTSALSIGVGANTGNSNAMIRGATGIGKEIVSAVNTFNAMMEKAQISYGSSDNALYAPRSITIRKTTHSKIITSTDEENKYKHLNGYPYKKCVTLSSLTTGNYIEVGEIHFDPKDNIIYQDEISEIVSLLQDGVIV